MRRVWGFEKDHCSSARCSVCGRRGRGRLQKLGRGLRFLLTNIWQERSKLPNASSEVPNHLYVSLVEIVPKIIEVASERMLFGSRLGVSSKFREPAPRTYLGTWYPFLIFETRILLVQEEYQMIIIHYDNTLTRHPGLPNVTFPNLVLRGEFSYLSTVPLYSTSINARRLRKYLEYCVSQ